MHRTPMDINNWDISSTKMFLYRKNNPVPLAPVVKKEETSFFHPLSKATYNNEKTSPIINPNPIFPKIISNIYFPSFKFLYSMTPFYHHNL